MSKSVDNRVVALEFDNSKFSKNMEATEKQLQEFEHSLELKGAEKGFKNIEAAANSLDLSGIQKSLDTINDRFSITGELFHNMLYGMVSSAIQASQQIVKALTIKPAMDGLSEYQMQMDAIQTISTNTKSKGTTIDDINAALDELNTYADKTIYNFSQMTKNIGAFTSAGVGLEDSVTAIQGLMNLAAGSGSSNAQAQNAAYQLSQALAAGQIRLQDWNSMQSANMSGELFQEELKKTARAYGIAVDQIIAEEGTFRDSLSKGWLTSDVMIETLARFADSTTDIGKELTAAATDIRTVTALFDSMGEAMGSPWAQTWRIIIGDLDEAKQLFNLLGHSFENVMNILNGGRNEMLQNWKDLGGRAELLKALENVLRAVERTVYNVSYAFKIFGPNINALDLYHITVKIREFTDHLELSKEQLAKFRDAIKVIAIPVGALLRIISGLIGAFVDFALWILPLAGDALLNILAPLGRFMQGVWSWIYIAKPFTKSFELLKTIFNELGKTIDVVAGLFRMIGTIINSTVKSITGVDIAATIQGWKDQVKSFFDSLFKGSKDVEDPLKSPFETATESVTDFFGSIREFLSGGDVFSWLVEHVGNATKSIVSFFQAIKDSKIWEVLGNIKDAVIGFVTIVKDKFLELAGIKSDEAGEFIDETDKKAELLNTIGEKLAAVWDFLVTVWNGLKDVLSKAWAAISEQFGGVWDKIQEGASQIDFGKLFGDIVKGGLAGGILGILWKLLDAFKNVSSIGESIAGFIDNFGGFLENIGESAKITATANAIKTIANSLLKILAAIVIIALMDSDTVSDSLATIALMIGELAGALGLTGKAMDGFKDAEGAIDTAVMMSMCKAINAFGTALIKMAVALAILTLLDQEKMKWGFLVISGLLLELGLMVGYVGNKLGALEKLEGVALAIKKFASAVFTLALAVALLTLFDTEKLAVSAIVIVALIFVFGLMVKEIGSNIGKMKQLDKVAQMLTSFGWSIILIAAAVAIMSQIPVQGLIIGAAALVAIMGIMVMLITEMTKIKPKKLLAAGQTMLMFAGAMLMMAAAIILMSLPGTIKGFGMAAGLAKVVEKLSKIRGKAVQAATGLVLAAVACSIMAGALLVFAFIPLPSILAGTVALIALMGMFAIIADVMNPQTVMPVATAMVAFGAALVLMATSLMMLKDFSFVDSWQGLAAIVVVMAIFIVVMYALQPVSGIMAGVAIALVAFGAAMLMLAVAMGLFAVALPLFASALLISLPLLLAALGAFLIELVGIIYLVILEIDKFLPDIIRMIVTFIGDLAMALIEPLLNFIRELLRLLGEYIPEITRLLVDLLLGILWGLLAGLADWIGPIVDEVFRLLINLLKALNRNLEEHGEELADQITDLFINILKLAYEALKKLFEKLAKWGKEIGENIGKGLTGDQAKELKNKIIKPIQDAWKGLCDFVDKFLKVGKDIINGLINGIKDAIANVSETVKNIGQDIYNGFCNFFHIGSPSRLMMGVGDYIMQGLDNGIIKRGKTVAKTAENESKKIAAGFEHLNDYIQAYLNDTSDYDMTITPVLDSKQLEMDISNMNSMLSTTAAFSPKYSLGNINTKQIIDIKTSNKDMVDAISRLNGDVNELRDYIGTMQIMLDGKALVGQMATPLNKKFGTMARTIKRGRL